MGAPAREPIMQIAVYAAFALGVGFEIAAAALSLVLPLRVRANETLWLPRLGAGLGAGFLALALSLRWLQYGLVPLTSGIESLSLLVIMLSITVLYITQDPRRRTLTLVYLPAIAGIAMVAAVLAPTELPHAPKQLSPWLLLLHVVPAFLAYAWFLVAMLTSSVYLYQSSRLKRHTSLGPVRQLPSLEHLDGTLYLLIRVAYPLFIWTLALGAYWAWYQRELLGAYWWFSPKIVLSLCMVVLYAVAYHGRSAGWLRGPKLAMMLVVGIGGLLVTYLGLEILELTNYNFWGGAA
jgi:ABC-type transport system involved in cytochrome c biogenesis permease subunit